MYKISLNKQNIYEQDMPEGSSRRFHKQSSYDSIRYYKVVKQNMMKISRRGYEENDKRSFSPKELIRLKKAKEE